MSKIGPQKKRKNAFGSRLRENLPGNTQQNSYCVIALMSWSHSEVLVKRKKVVQAITRPKSGWFQNFKSTYFSSPEYFLLEFT